jgi:uncharacterized repeat protein (TIGR03847 family)
MPEFTFDLSPVTRITASALGPPGQRTFFIQAQQGVVQVTLLCEKEQVAALSTALQQLLEQLDQRYPAAEPEDKIPLWDLELKEPLQPEFRVGQMGLGYDEDAGLIVLIAQELLVDEETSETSVGRTARFLGTRSQMRALSQYAAEVVAHGRPICPLCGQPMDPEGHFCPKRNGHSHPFEE